MRTTILLDDELAENLRKAARIRGLSFSAFIAEAGRAALKASISNKEEPFELIVTGGGGPKPGIDLDKTSQLLAAEDEERYGS
jgi:hypothetical protein